MSATANPMLFISLSWLILLCPSTIAMRKFIMSVLLPVLCQLWLLCIIYLCCAVVILPWKIFHGALGLSMAYVGWKHCSFWWRLPEQLQCLCWMRTQLCPKPGSWGWCTDSLSLGAGLVQPDVPVVQTLVLNPILNPMLNSATALMWRDISVFADASQSLPQVVFSHY